MEISEDEYNIIKDQLCLIIRRYFIYDLNKLFLIF